MKDMIKRLIVIILCANVFYTATAQTKNLDFYVQQAISNSPLLKDYQNQVSLNGFDSLLIKATYKPQVNALSYNTYAPVVNGYGYDQIITNGGGYSALVSANQTIVGKNHLSTQLQSIQLLNQSLKNTIKISEQDLKKSIIAQYISAYGDQVQYNLNQQLIDILKKEELILKSLVEKGIYHQTDYLTFLVSVQQQQLVLKQLAMQYKDDIATLNYLCGITDTSFVNLTEPTMQIETLPSINNSVFFQQFSIDSLKLANQKLLVNYNYHPKFNIFADAGFYSSFMETAYKNFGTSIGFSLIFPIYDGNQKKTQYSKISIEDKTRQNYKDFYTSQYKQKISQLTQQLNSADELITEIKLQLKYADALITADKSLLQTGEVHIADYMLAITNYLNIKNQLTLNIINRLQIINQINYWNR